jgi:formate hydrogenlyase transcriptional activator
MSAKAVCPIDVEAHKRLLLDMARERSVDRLLHLIVGRLAAQPHVALARVWLVGPGDVCPDCPMRGECPDQSACLHLVASAGRSRKGGGEWDRLDGEFHRIPLGVRKVGLIASSARPLEVPDLAEEPHWLAHPEWARREGIRAFGGQPLIHRGEVLGVLAVFTRSCLGEENLTWLRMIADHAAAAIANARAFEEIGRLKQQLEWERDYLRDEVREAQAFGDVVGKSDPLRAVLRQVELVAPTEATVLILGESGTGKELVAREIHKRSARAGHPMVKVNCASVPRELYESEFFGHVKGAFTGAVADRAGRFELADGGTLFLDEVGEIPLALQSKLLRVLQEGDFERVGEERTRRVDVRILAATNRDLLAEVRKGRFREDLYYRLNVFPITLAPLRQRKEDIAPLAAHFLALSARKLGRRAPRLTQADVQRLQEYDWPGNVRELQNVLERAVITSTSGRLQLDLPVWPEAGSQGRAEERAEEAAVVPDAELRRRERANILTALRRADGKVSGPGGAAELLGLKPTTLASRMKAMNIRRPG